MASSVRDAITITIMDAINFYYADTGDTAPDTSGLHPEAASWQIMFTPTAEGDAMGRVASSYGEAATQGLYEWAACVASTIHDGPPEGYDITVADILYALRLGLRLWDDWQ